MSQEEFNVKADRFATIVLVPVLLGLIAIGAIIAVATWPNRTVAPPPSDMKLVSGNPRVDWVAVFHDQRRQTTCYVNTQHGGIFCELDIVIADQLGMLAYRDAGLP